MSDKPTGCIKTGAKVYFANYDVLINSDVYRIGSAILIRTHAGQLDRASYSADQGNDSVDLTITSQGNGEEFWRSDLGVFVVPEDTIKFYTEM
jgi:hypothetical protein